MFMFLRGLIHVASQILIFLVIVYVITTYVLPPTHPVRYHLGRWVEPMLALLRRVVPPLAGIDITPVLLILLIQLAARLLEEALLLIF